MEQKIIEEQKVKKEEQEKKKADDLWSSFMSDVGSRPTSKSSLSQSPSSSTVSKVFIFLIFCGSIFILGIYFFLSSKISISFKFSITHLIINIIKSMSVKYRAFPCLFHCFTSQFQRHPNQKYYSTSDHEKTSFFVKRLDNFCTSNI